MKLRLFSDIHYEHDERAAVNSPGVSYPENAFWKPYPLDTDSETTLLLLGDIYNGGKKAIKQIKRYHARFERVIIVLGNHDYWGQDIHTLVDEMRMMLQEERMDNVFILDNNTLEIDDFVLVGTTLFTDMDKHNPLVIIDAPRIMGPDFSFIHQGEKFDEYYVSRKIPFNTDLWLLKHQYAVDYIKVMASKYKDKKVVVLSHYAPTMESIHERFKQYGLSNYYFASDLSDLILDHENIKYWMHGHTHTQTDYMIGQCRVLANQRGYPNEFSQFKENGFFEI